MTLRDEVREKAGRILDWGEYPCAMRGGGYRTYLLREARNLIQARPPFGVEVRMTTKDVSWSDFLEFLSRNLWELGSGCGLIRPTT